MYARVNFRVFALGMLLLWTSPSASACSYAPISSIKANQHQLQTILETYYEDHHAYPPSTLLLKEEAVKQGYWKEFNNPLEYTQGYGEAYLDVAATDLDEKAHRVLTHKFKVPTAPKMYFGLRVVKTIERGIYPRKGILLYQYISKQRYRVCAVGRKDYELIMDRDKVFCLSEET